MPENWLGGFYQVYPVEETLPELSEKWVNGDLNQIEAIFPDRLEAYCILAFISAMEDEENGGWAGATYHYFDRLAVGGLRREHARTGWKRLGRYIASLGRVKGLTRTDVFILLMPSFTQLFWGSMKSLVSRGYVRVEQREIDSVDVDVFFPTARLVNKMNFSPSD